MPLSITSMFAGLFALMMIALSLPVSLRRVCTGNASVTGSGDNTLRRRIRAHGNFCEYVPLALICVGLMEAFPPRRTAAGDFAPTDTGRRRPSY